MFHPLWFCGAILIKEIKIVALLLLVVLNSKFFPFRTAILQCVAFNEAFVTSLQVESFMLNAGLINYSWVQMRDKNKDKFFVKDHSI